MSDDVQQQLIDDHFLFKEGDRFLQVQLSTYHGLALTKNTGTGGKCESILANRAGNFPQRGEDIPGVGW